MPDNDPLESLDNFSEGLHVNALPASEVRRRGDRMRRRNTALATVGGVVAAAVFIGTPVALMSGNDDDVVQPAPPAPSQTDSPSDGEWLTQIPAEFPLADSFPETNGLDGSPTEVVDESVLTPVQLCGVEWPTGRSVDAAGITYTGESEDTSDRTLLLLEDEASAQASVDDLREAVRACPNQPTGGGDSVLLSSLVDQDLGTEDSVVVAQRVQFDDGLISDLTMTAVARTGNALFVVSSYGSAASDDVVAFEAERLRERSAVPLGAMCVFSADPCSTSEVTPVETEAPEPAESGTAAIPAGFPLAEGMDETAESDVEGPAPDVEGSPVVDVCGTDVWAASGVVQRLAARETGPEHVDTRELLTFITADEPAEALTQVREAVTGCPRLDGELAGYRTKVLEGPPGYDSFTWGWFTDEGLGGGVFQMTRVGSAVLVLYAAGESSETTLQPGADALSEVTLAIAPQMCVFTEDGC
jgi:ferredoxin